MFSGKKTSMTSGSVGSSREQATPGCPSLGTCTLPRFNIDTNKLPCLKGVTCSKAHRFWYLMLNFTGVIPGVFFKIVGSQSQHVFSNIFAGLFHSYERSAVEPLACHARGEVMMTKWCSVVVKLIAFTFLRGSR